MFKMHHKNLRVHFFQAESEESLIRYVLYFIFILLASPKEQTKKNIQRNLTKEGGRQGHRNRIKRVSLRSRRLEVVGERENGRARGRHACLLACVLFLAHYFQAPATQAKRESEMLRMTKYKKRD